MSLLVLNKAHCEEIAPSTWSKSCKGFFGSDYINNSCETWPRFIFEKSQSMYVNTNVKTIKSLIFYLLRTQVNHAQGPLKFAYQAKMSVEVVIT